MTTSESTVESADLDELIDKNKPVHAFCGWCCAEVEYVTSICGVKKRLSASLGFSIPKGDFCVVCLDLLSSKHRCGECGRVI